jgi:hypothetical protein
MDVDEARQQGMSSQIELTARPQAGLPVCRRQNGGDAVALDGEAVVDQHGMPGFDRNDPAGMDDLVDFNHDYRSSGGRPYGTIGFPPDW